MDEESRNFAELLNWVSLSFTIRRDIWGL